MKTRYAYLLALGLSAAGTAHAACDVSLSSVLSNGQVVLKANCGAVDLDNITWLRDGSDISGAIDVSTYSPKINAADVYYTTTAQGGTHYYTATANAGAVTAGTRAVVTTANPTLTVAPTAGGTVASSPAGITGCASGSGLCSATFTSGATVSLTATATTGYVFSNWAGDCTGTGAVCAVAMTGPRAVTANFGPVPVNGACGSKSNATPVSGTPTDPNLCSAGTATSVNDPNSAPYYYTWGCNGVNGGTSTTSTACSAPKQIAGVCGPLNGGSAQSTTPSDPAQLCSAGTPSTVSSRSSPAYEYYWTCNGINSGAASGECKVSQAATDGVCGSKHNGNTASTPTGTEACTGGSITSMTAPASAGGDYTWTCAGTGGSAVNASCLAHQTVNGACGSASGQSFPTLTSGSANLCVAGTTVASFSGTGPWTWGCNGVNGGTSTTATACSASLQAASSDPGRWTGLWKPDFLADGVTPNDGTLIVADPTGSQGAGTVSYTPGCLNQKDYTNTTCEAAGSLTANLYGTATSFTVTQAFNKIVAIRYRSAATVTGGYYTINNNNGASTGYSVTTSLSTIPGDFNVNAKCISTSTTTPKVIFGTINSVTYCPFSPNTNYYVNIRVNPTAGYTSCTGSACNFKISESTQLQ